MADHMRTELVCDALQMALAQRRPAPGLIWHSDQGSQFVALAFGQQARAAGIAQSMGSKGDCYDTHALAESFLDTFKTSSSATASGAVAASSSWPSSSTSVGSITPGCTPRSATSHPASSNKANPQASRNGTSPACRAAGGKSRSRVKAGRLVALWCVCPVAVRSRVRGRAERARRAGDRARRAEGRRARAAPSRVLTTTPRPAGVRIATAVRGTRRCGRAAERCA
jgi:hypothetical protein